MYISLYLIDLLFVIINQNMFSCFDSMKRARVFSVSHGVPDGSPFTSYRDFKRHWKNMVILVLDMQCDHTRCSHSQVVQVPT